MKKFTATDGKLVLTLQPANEGGYVVTSPFDPQLITEAETLEEAFENAREAALGLRQSRTKLVRQLAAAGAANTSATMISRKGKLTQRR
jgi:hypothetical protein